MAQWTPIKTRQVRGSRCKAGTPGTVRPALASVVTVKLEVVECSEFHEAERFKAGVSGESRLCAEGSERSEAGRSGCGEMGGGGGGGEMGGGGVDGCVGR